MTIILPKQGTEDNTLSAVSLHLFVCNVRKIEKDLYVTVLVAEVVAPGSFTYNINANIRHHAVYTILLFTSNITGPPPVFLTLQHTMNAKVYST